jgi:hypothetical protein
LYSWLAKKYFWKKLKKEAKRLGYQHEVTQSYDDFGVLRAYRAGRNITVRICYDNPSAGPWVSVSLNLNQGILDIKTNKPHLRPLEGWTDFDSPNWIFNRMYKTRRVVKKYLDKMQNSDSLFEHIVSFYQKWMFQLSRDMGLNGLDIDGKSITCIFGPPVISSMAPFIKPPVLEKILSEMLNLAEHFDKTMID